MCSGNCNPAGGLQAGQRLLVFIGFIGFSVSGFHSFRVTDLYLHVLAFPLEGFRLFERVAVPLFHSAHKGVVVSLVRNDIPRVQVQNICADCVQELTRVTDHQQRLGPLQKVVLQGEGRVQVGSQ